MSGVGAFFHRQQFESNLDQHMRNAKVPSAASAVCASAVQQCLGIAVVHVLTCPCLLCSPTGGNLDAVPKDFKEKYKLPAPKEGDSADKAPQPRKCHFVELLIEEKADVSGVADTYLGTSWLHEVVR